MDYCSSCRRHLNGALACPGCGAYAPDIAAAARNRTTTGVAATAAWDEAPFGTWHDAGRFEEPVAAADPAEVPADDVTDAPPVAEGRAARRRQRERWRRNQRKALVATAVALVGGGLTVSAMNQQSNARVQAATAPDNRSMGEAELPTVDGALPASTPAEAHQASTNTPAKTVTSHRKTVDSASTTRSLVHTDSAATPTPTATTAAGSQTTLSSSVAATVDTTTDTATEATSTPTATDTDTTTTTGSSGTSETSPSSTATEPTQLCVLNLLCIS